MTWQPIETAPKDTPILVWGKAIGWRGVCFGYAHSDYNGHKHVVTLDGKCGYPTPYATHWTSLPKPPEAA